MTDFSFLKLYENDFNQAAMNDNSQAFETRYNGFVQMLPNEKFIQYTNAPNNIAFAGNLKVELINVCGNILKDITDSFFYTEITDIHGVKQLRYQFGNILTDYYDELLFLKLTHTVSEKIWYSAGFFVTYNNQYETALFHYENKNYFKGISYDKTITSLFAPQIIRLCCFLTDKTYKKESEEYTELSGNVVSSRSIISDFDRYRFYTCDFFTFDRLKILLDHDLIYINGKRISNKPTAEKEDRWEDSNLFPVTFEANPTDEILPEIDELWPLFELTFKVPDGVFTLATLPTEIEGSYTKPLFLGKGEVKIWNKTTNTLFHTYTETSTDLSIAGNTFTIDWSALTFTNGDYFITVSDDFLRSKWGEKAAEVYWPFTIQDAEFDAGEFDNTEFLT